ncbi:MAG TPA: redoxin domain-containing protein [Candidatus Paceibacterota bacterium]|nr:redoxin domain-containing protein [Candidatus Paceibacterota bacterium]
MTLGYRKWTLTGAIAAIVLVIWLIQRGTVMPPPLISDADIPLATPVPDKESRYARAKELVGVGEFINSPPFALADFIGEKVILIDFWTYSCINCQRTQPYLNDWWSKYKDDGLLIVGVHTPEFEFEKDPMNVRKAVAQAGIGYPVVQDNDYQTWRAYRNQYWPRKYLIDADGYIVYDHIGEGAYEETERKIQELLIELAGRRGTDADAVTSDMGTPEGAVEVEYTRVGTPEIYLGAWRNEQYLGNAATGTEGLQSPAMPGDDARKANLVYLGGRWDFAYEYVRCVSDCVLRIRYTARQVNIVAGAPGSRDITVLRDGAEWGSVRVSDETLYTVVDDPEGYGTHELELRIPAGLDLFTFTFG